VRIRPPVPGPRTIDCMAVNYMEDGTRSAPAPINAFHKSPSAIIGHGDTMVLPDVPAIIFEGEAEMAVVIGKRARITDAFIGPYTSISDDAVIEHAEIEYSIILERARIVDLDARIESSLVGRDALITRSDQKPRAHRFMVGDSSQIWVL